MQIRDLMPWGRKAPEISRGHEDDNPLAGLQREMNRVFDNFWSRFDRNLGALNGGLGGGFPRAEMVETDKTVEVSFELPGMDEKDIDVSVSDDMLVVRGEKKAEREESKKGHYLSERSYGAFHRAIPLPPGVAAYGAKAEFKRGVLTINLPKTEEAQAKVRKIAVKAE